MQFFLAALRSPDHRDERFVHAGCRSDWFNRSGMNRLRPGVKHYKVAAAYWSTPVWLGPLAPRAPIATVRQWCLRLRKNGVLGGRRAGAGLSEVSLCEQAQAYPRSRCEG